jgi:hypothetical protein
MAAAQVVLGGGRLENDVLILVRRRNNGPSCVVYRIGKGEGQGMPCSVYLNVKLFRGSSFTHLFTLAPAVVLIIDTV